MSIFDLALLQAKREGKEDNLGVIIDYAIKIRKYLDKKEEAKENSRFKKIN
jgi:hypothetical protein